MMDSCQHAAFVGWDHVLDVDKSVLSSSLFEELQGILDEVTQVALLSLGVVDLVSCIVV